MPDEPLLDQLMSALDSAAKLARGDEDERSQATQDALGASAMDVPSDTGQDLVAASLAMAEARALGNDGQLHFAAWLDGSPQWRSVAFTLGTGSPPDEMDGEEVSAIRFDDFIQLLETQTPLYPMLVGRAGWTRLEIPDLGWILWTSESWPPQECRTDSTTARAIRTLTGDRKLMESALAQGSKYQSVHTALDAIGLVTGFAPNPAAQAIGVGSDMANFALYVGEGDVGNAGLSAVSLLSMAGVPVTILRSSDSAVMGFKVSETIVEELGSIGILRRIRAARSYLKLPVDLADYLLEFGIYDDFIRVNESLLVRLLNLPAGNIAGEQAIDGVLTAHAWLHHFGYVSKAQALDLAKKDLELAETLLRESSHIPGVDDLFLAMQKNNESSIIGARFELDWVTANRADIVEVATLEGRASGGYQEGVDVVMRDRVVELKAYKAKNLNTAAAEDFSRQIRSRLELAEFVDPITGATAMNPHFAKVDLVISRERLNHDELPPAFVTAMEEQIAILMADFAHLSPAPEITVKLYP